MVIEFHVFILSSSCEAFVAKITKFRVSFFVVDQIKKTLTYVSLNKTIAII